MKPPAHDLSDGVAGRPRFLSEALGDFQRLERAPRRPRGLDERKPLGRGPKHVLSDREARGTARRLEGAQPLEPASLFAVTLADGVKQQKRIVHFFDVARLGPGLRPHPVDRVLVERAQVRRAARVEPAA